MHFTTLATYLALGATGWAGYTLEDDYFSGGDFFSQFSFWDQADPTNGFVSYGRHDNLLESSANNAKMWVSNATSAPNGRESIRITSNKSYQSGLVVLDVESMPGGVCGSWPAFWMVGPDWPNQGEIDIIEGVNTDSTNQMTLHTGPGCSIANGAGGAQSKAMAMTGTVETTTCASSGDNNAGCGIVTSDAQSFGAGLTDSSGGVYATEWTTTGISVYYFPRSSIPSDIDGGSPDPSSWGSPMAHFSGGCDFGTSFTNQQIVFDTTFCGDWAGSDDVWGQSCAASTGKTCQDYVAQNGEDFEGQFWSVNSLKVYQNNGGSSAPSSAAPAPSASAPAQSSAVSQGWPNSSVPASSYAPAPTASASQSGWAPIVSGSAVGSAPGAAPTSSAAPAPTTSAAASPSSPAETQSSQSWQQQPSQTWGGGNPWQSGSPWGQSQESDDGSWSVGTPAMKRRHARHLAQHKRHAGAGHAGHAAGRLS